jgi:hypothetical protein
MESLKTMGGIQTQSFAGELQNCASSGTMAQFLGGWRKSRGAVEACSCAREKKRISKYNHQLCPLEKNGHSHLRRLVWTTGLRGWLVFGRNLVRGLHHFIQKFLELGKAG